MSARSGGVCEICGSRWATNWHHRKAAGRVWVASNGMHLCGSGSTLCHGYVTENPTAARERGWSVPSWLDPAETPVWLYGRGWSVLSDDGSIASAEPDDEENTA